MFPVNESIWEHMKLILFSFYFINIFDYIYFTKNNIKFNNYFIQLFIIPLLSILLYLSIYLPIYNLMGENIIFSISLLFIVIIVEQLLSYLLLTNIELKHEKIIGIIGIIITITIFGYLTYNPIKNYLFYDTLNNKYGINIFVK